MSSSDNRGFLDGIEMEDKVTLELPLDPFFDLLEISDSKCFNFEVKVRFSGGF